MFLSFEGDWDELRANIRSPRQPATKNFVKSEKVKENWTRPKNFDFWFYVRFDHFFHELIFWGENW